MPSINTLERIPEGDELVAVEDEKVWLAAAKKFGGREEAFWRHAVATNQEDQRNRSLDRMRPLAAACPIGPGPGGKLAAACPISPGPGGKYCSTRQ